MRPKFLIYQEGRAPFGVTIGSRMIKLHFRRDTHESVLETFIARYIGRHMTVRHSTLHANKFLITIKVTEPQSQKLSEFLDSMPDGLNVKSVRTFGRLFR